MSRLTQARKEVSVCLDSRPIHTALKDKLAHIDSGLSAVPVVFRQLVDEFGSYGEGRCGRMRHRPSRSKQGRREQGERSGALAVISTPQKHRLRPSTVCVGRYSASGSKPFGSCGGSTGVGRLQAGHGAPAPPQLQACGPSQGWSGWFSQTDTCSMGHFFLAIVAISVAILLALYLHVIAL